MTSLMRIESHQRSTIVIMHVMKPCSGGPGQRGKCKDYWPCGSTDVVVVVVVPHYDIDYSIPSLSFASRHDLL